MLMIPARVSRTRFADWPLAWKSILGFWLFYATTVALRAFLGTDPWTTLGNRLVVIGIGILINGFIYLAVAGFASGASLRRKTVTAGIGCVVGALVLGGTVVLTQDWLRPSKEEFRYQAREGFWVVERGQQIRIERTAQEPLVLTLPKIRELDSMKRIRFALDASVTWLFFFIAWSAFYLASQAHRETLGAQRRVAASR